MTQTTETRGRRPADAATRGRELAGQLARAEAQAAEDAPLLEALRTSGLTLRKEEMAGHLRLAEAVGAIRAFRLNAETNRVALLRGLAQIKAQKLYRDAVVQGPDGLVRVRNWAGFCEAVGLKVSTTDEDLKFLKALGSAVLEQQEALGLSRRDLRALARGMAEAATEEERQRIAAELDAAEGSPELEKKIDALSRDLMEARAARLEAEKDLAASRKMRDEEARRHADMAERYAKLSSTNPEDREGALSEYNVNSRAKIDAACEELFRAVQGLCLLADAVRADEKCDGRTQEYAEERACVAVRHMAGMLQEALQIDTAMLYAAPGDEEAAEAAAGATDGALPRSASAAATAFAASESACPTGRGAARHAEEA